MCDRRLFGLSGGLRCTGSGVGHTHQYEASDSGITDAPKEDAL
jgi:hypothetical protein